MNKRTLALLCALSLLFSCIALSSCASQNDLPGGNGAAAQKPAESTGEGTRSTEPLDLDPLSGQAEEILLAAQANFAMTLFREGYKLGDAENTLVSPLSVMLALAMTANGASGTTKDEMVALLGGSASIEELNSFLAEYVRTLPESGNTTLKIANSLWVRDLYTLQSDFHGRVSRYYNADAYSAPFSGETVKQINDWVKEKTDGMIDKILEEIPESAALYLINALSFDAKWASPYEEDAIRDAAFTNKDGQTQTVRMMYSTETTYLSDQNTTGFMKSYSDRYSFAALLPKEGINIDDYVASLTGETWQNLMKTAKRGSVGVTAGLPQFEAETKLTLNQLLSDAGMPTAFNKQKAEFSGMINEDDRLYISKVLHKTFIAVDGLGTKAGAVTSVQMDTESSGLFYAESYTVILNRPFVYAIVDNETGLPVFIGVVTTLG